MFKVGDKVRLCDDFIKKSKYYDFGYTNNIGRLNKILNKEFTIKELEDNWTIRKKEDNLGYWTYFTEETSWRFPSKLLVLAKEENEL